jgi:ribosomal protein L40E
MDEFPTAPDEATALAPCRLCESPLPPDAKRCPACGLHRATDLSRPELWRLGAGLAVLYLATAVLLLLVR